jgi:hypothetical protein
LSGVKEASGWWQAEIVRQGVHAWNLWRQANPGIRPDLRGQNLSLEDPAPPYSPDCELQRPRSGIRDLSGINFASADLTSACLYFSDLSDADLRAANLQDANLDECGLSGADFQGATLTRAEFSASFLFGANLTDAIGLTQAQLESAYGDLETKLPVGLKRPFSWSQAGASD